MASASTIDEVERAQEFQLRLENIGKKLEHLKIHLSDIKLATNDFSEVYTIASSGAYTLYKAELQYFDNENPSPEKGRNKGEHLMRCTTVIIKRYHSGHEANGEEAFFTEIEILTSVKHPNIVTLLGFCVEASEMILVIENVYNGYLGDYLGSVNGMRILTWEKRLKICIDVAHALNYIHSWKEDQKRIINRDIYCHNIGLDENWGAKIVDFGFSVFLPPNHEDEALYLNMIYGRKFYTDPEYLVTGKLQRESDVYSFGVVLFEILCGRLAFDPIYKKEHDKGLAPVARRNFSTGTIKEMIDPIIKEETSENNFVLTRGPNKDSLYTFIEIAHQCLAETQDQRPTMKVVVKELEKALLFQKNVDNPRISFEDVKAATQNFHDDNCIGGGGFGKVYKGSLLYGDGFKTIVAKRLDPRFGQGEQQFLSELQILWEYKHENVITLVGYCDENDEKVIVYEYASRGSLDRYLNDATLTWVKRLNICIDVARALHFLHGGVGKQAKVIHRDIKTANILLNRDWKTKLADFGLSLLSPLKQETDYVIDHACGTVGYLDPLYRKTGFLTIESDIYSFGVVLFEILCGRSTFATHKQEGRYLPDFIKKKFEEGKHDDVVFEQIREQMDPKSLATFQKIAYQCLDDEREKRPTMKEVLTQLKNALELQTYKSVAHLEIRLKEIVSATNNFADENLIREGGFGKDYKGEMLISGQLIVICARRLNRKYGLGDIEFWTEISMHSRLEHKNIISFVGFCDEDEEKIIVYEHAVNGSLDQHLSDPNLTWFQRLKICLGVARAMKYLHYDVIHCDINSSKIFLDKDWEPKIFGFELSTEYPQSWRHRLLFSRHFDNTNITPKYDVYSFGVLLFELVCGKKPMIDGDDSVKKQLDDIIVPNLEKKMDRQSLTVFTNIIYKCLNHQFVQLLTMDRIVKDLQRMLKLQGKQENLVRSSVVEDATPLKGRLKTEWLMLPLTEIMRATDNFDEKHSVGHGAFGVVYKAILDVLEIQNFSSVEGKYQDKLLKKSKTVAIKRILNRQDEHGKEGFLTEIELLTSCKHPNVVSLVGFCREAREMILVYEYALKGSLNDYFGNNCKMINLTWAQRMQICLDIAHGINYLHSNMEDKPKIIHRDIKSGNILLDENLTAKVADFGLSKFHPKDHQASTMYSENAVGTKVYTDPEYLTTCKYKKESDIYSFGVVLFEILCGRVAYDPIYLAENVKGLAPIARRHFSEGTLKELLDRKMIEEDDKNIFTLNRGPNQDSFDVFSRIAYQCLAEIQDKRPTMEVVIKELDRALKLQGETVVLTRFQLRDIRSATDNFSELYCIGMHDYGTVYKADLYDYVDKSSLAFEEKDRRKKCITVAIKRISSSGDEKQRFFSEIEMHTSRKHSNIASLLGFCDEGDEIMLVFEHGSNRSLDEYLKNADNMDKFKWTQRLHVCLGIAHGLNHLHTKMDRQERIIQRDIRSVNILLGENWEPKISYFGISNFHLANQKESTLTSTQVYWDPEFERRRIMKRKTDIYSFGVILFKIFCGELAYDPIYLVENDKELTPKARNHFNDGTIKKLLDPNLKAATHDDDNFTSSRGPNQDSLDTFLKIARQCLEEAQAERPTMEIVIKELEMALNFQENLMERLQLSLKDIKMATDHFSQKNLVGRGIYWDAYKGNLSHADASTTIVAKRWGSKFDDQFWTELDILSKRKHKNIIGLVGYSNEMNEKVTVYEYMSKGSLDKCLKDSNLKWMKRLGICIDVASALEFLHGGDVTLQMVVHRNIKSHAILLNAVWDAKLSNFELSSIDSLNQVMEHIEKSDIYSFGVVLFEILCGRLAWVDGFENNSQSLVPLAKHYYEQGKLIEMVFMDIRKQIGSESLTTFADIAYQCLNEDGSKRPEASEVVTQLKKALELQEDYEIWEPKLPTDYKEIIQSISKHSDINNSLETKKDMYDMFTKGIFLHDSKVLFSLGSKGERNETVSARMFSRKNHTAHKWLSVPESRFPKALKMHDSSNLKIQIKIRTQFLPSCANYKVVLIFRFCSPTKSQAKRIYVNLKYKMGNETMHAYFATWREDGWMTIELFRFLNHQKDTEFEVLLESFSRCYCGRHSVYIEGIQFQEIDNVKHEEIRKSKEVQKVMKSKSKSKSKTKKLSSSKMKVKKDHMTWFSLSEIKIKKNEMLSAKKVVYNSSYVAIQSRFSGAVEFLQQQVFRIKCRIKSQLLFANKENVCYLVFKLSDKCRGLHGPVIVRDLFHWRSKETRTLYFRSPNLWNLHDNHWVAKRRKDGWMEVILWKFKSNKEVKNDHLCVHLKLVTYEGTMAGLIVRNLEFRQI